MPAKPEIGLPFFTIVQDILNNPPNIQELQNQFKAIEKMPTFKIKYFRMKTKIIKTKETGSWALPGDPITLDEFKVGIKEVEKGPFYTIGQSKKIIE